MTQERVRNSRAGRFLEKMDSQITSREYRDDEVVFGQKDVADAMFYIQHGNVKLTVVSSHGKKAVIGILSQGDFFGEGCLTKQSLRVSTATAIHRSTITRVAKSALARLIRQKPAFAKLFMTHLISRIRSADENMMDQLFNNSERRLARILVLLTRSGEDPGSDGTTLNISQGTLAEMTGTTRSRVSFFMNRFRNMGFIQYNGRLQVHPSLLTFLRNDGANTKAGTPSRG
jgi:CRP/FNR family transcriptional regulator, cyclic AMP receptor protein